MAALALRRAAVAPPVAPPSAPRLKLVVSRPAAVWPAPPPVLLASSAMTPTMKRCLLLALLLHIWLVLMLGSAPGGTAAPGQGVAGTLNITLQGPETPGATEQAAPPVPVVPEGAPGSATLPRWGGVVREQATPLPSTPGAAQLGQWTATPQPADAPAVPPPPPGRVVDEVAEAAGMAEAVPTAVLRAPAPQQSPAALPALAAEATMPAPALVATPVDAPAALPAPVVERRLAAPAARALPELGAAMPMAPLPVSPTAALPVAPALPAVESIAPRLTPTSRPVAAELPALAPAAPVAPLPLAPPALPPLATLPPAPAPVAAEPEAPSAQPAPPALPALSVPPAPTAAPAAAPPQPARPLASTPQPTPLPSPVTAPGRVPSATPSPSLPPAAYNPGAPDAGSRLGADVATPPSAAASVPQRLNLQLSRPRGGELSRARGAGALPVMPRPPEIDEKLGRDIAKSAKQDCRDAFRGAGLLAVVPLAAEALKADSRCKW